MGIAPRRTALVTGGASGLGLEVARRLVAAGSRVAGVDISEPSLAAAVAELGSAYVPIEADVRDHGAATTAVATAVS